VLHATPSDYAVTALQGTGLKTEETFVQQHGARPHKPNIVPYFLNKNFHVRVIANQYRKGFSGLV
jgi:hypothetical protein